MDILEYKGKFNFQNRDWNKTSVDKLKELRQVAIMAFKSQDNMTEMPGKDPGEDAFKKLCNISIAMDFCDGLSQPVFV